MYIVMVLRKSYNSIFLCADQAIISHNAFSVMPVVKV